MALNLRADYGQTRGAVPRRLHQKRLELKGLIPVKIDLTGRFDPITVSEGGEIGSMAVKKL